MSGLAPGSEIVLPGTVDHTFRIRYAETDQMGVVHNAVYPVWFEMGRTELSHARGFSYADIENAGLVLMVAELNVRYKRPAYYDNLVTIRTTIARARSKVVVFGYRIFDSDSRDIIADGETVHVVVSKETGKSARMPEDILKHYTPAPLE